jgi:hypothetical protein
VLVFIFILITETHLVSTDYQKKKSDKVNRHKLTEILIEDNIPDLVIMTVYETYIHNLLSARIQPEISKCKDVN